MKNNMKRTILLAAIPLLLGLPSCGETDNTIHFWCTFGEGAVRPAVQSAIDKFCELVKEKEGVDVKFSLDYQGDYNTLLDKVKKSFSAGGTPTIAVAYPDHVADYLAMEGTPGDYVYDLTKYVNDSEIGFTKQTYLGDSSDYDEDDFVTAFYEEGKQYQREGIYSLPFMKSSEVMAYNENAVLRAMKFWKPEITTASALRNYLSTISWTEFIEMNKVILQNKDQIISSLTCPIYYDSDANFLISKICQLEIPYASVDENGKGHIDFETGEARTKVEALVTSIKEAYDAKLLETKGIANKYGSTAFQNQQCLFVIGSSGGSGYSMPKAGSFTANVVRVPSSATNPLNRNLYVTQGPTITFLKNRSLSNEENDRRMHYSWMLAKYLTNPEVNTNVTLLGSEGYIPVRESAYETDLWIEWSQVGDMVTKAANTLVQDINGSYLTTKVFKGSAALREKIGGVIASVCKTGTPVSKAVGDANWVDYVKNGTVKLGLDHKNRSFWTDGVEEVTLKSCIDGDTAHFATSTGATLKARFYGVNTPESTGEIQEYGKEASNFTKKKLEEASKNGTIVVSSAQSSYGTPNPDSTGSRYVSLVWINLDTKNADRDHLYLLNLWIVQEGYSWVKNVNDMPEYVDTFIAAENQAKNYKLNLFSGKPAPLFNYGDYEDTSLLDIKHEVEETLKDPDHVNRFNGSKCRVVGTVAGYSNNILYIQNFYADDPDDPTKGGEYASLNIFCGMTTIPVRFYTINTYIEICGVCTDSENFGFQMSGVHFPKTSSSTGPDDARVIIKAEDNTGEFSLHRFEYTAAELQSKVEAKSTEALNCAIQVTDFVEVKKDKGYTSEDGDITIYTAAGWGIYITFGYQATEVDVYDSHTYFQGKKIKVAGVMGIHKTASGSYQWQVIPSNSADIQLMD